MDEPLPLRLRAKEGEEGKEVLVAVVAASMLLSRSDLLLLPVVPSWRGTLAAAAAAAWSPRPALQGGETNAGEKDQREKGVQLGTWHWGRSAACKRLQVERVPEESSFRGEEGHRRKTRREENVVP